MSEAVLALALCVSFGRLKNILKLQPRGPAPRPDRCAIFARSCPSREAANDGASHLGAYQQLLACRDALTRAQTLQARWHQNGQRRLGKTELFLMILRPPRG